MKKRERKFNADKILGLSAILISVMTLFILLYQTNIIKQQSRLSVRPRLTFSKGIGINESLVLKENDSTTSTLIKITLKVRNNGLGPAIIDSNVVINDMQSYNILDFFDEAYPRLKELGVFTQITELKVGEAIPESETVELFTYQYNVINEQQIFEYLGVESYYELPFRIRIEYSSIYEERWMVESDKKGHPVKIN